MSLFLQMRFNGTVLATGTGFIAISRKGPVLVTNRHNVTGRNQETNEPLSSTCGVPNEIIIYHHLRGRSFSWVPIREQLYSDPNEQIPRWIEHPILGSLADIVALPLTQIDDVQHYPYNPASPGHGLYVGPADPVSVIGFPFGMSAGGYLPVWATGFLASEPDVNFGDLPVQLIDCRSRQGQSGSPVIAYRSGGANRMRDGGTGVFDRPVWEFIGIYSGRINSESDIGRVWKAHAIAEVIDCV